MKLKTNSNSKAKVFSILLVFLSFSFIFSQSPFITIWDTNINNDNSRQIRFFAKGHCSYSYVKLDDLSINGSGYFNGEYDNGVLTTLVLPKKGIYKLSITPTSGLFAFQSAFNDLPDTNKLLEVSQWGDSKWVNMSQTFYNCTNLKITAQDKPNLDNVKDLSYMFYGCKNLDIVNGINEWNVGKIENMGGLFKKSSFNQSLDKWDTSNVISMYSMFQENYMFNQPLNNWNTSKVTDMSFMFSFSGSFNQPLGNWDTSKVVNMCLMFFNAKNFNQSLNWDIGRISLGGYSYYNSLSKMFDYSGLDCENYKNTLKAWSERGNTPNNLNLGGYNIFYGTEAKIYRDYLINQKGWKVEGDQFNPSQCATASTYETSLSNILIYPNPFNDRFIIKSDNSFKDAYIKIFTMEGKLVFQKHYQSIEQIEIYLNTTLPLGIYNLIISSSGLSKSYMLIKK